MRYKVLSRDNRELAGFNTAQSVADYLFALPAEEVNGLYVLDTKENAAFPYCTYRYEWENLAGTHHMTFSDVLKTLKQGK